MSNPKVLNKSKVILRTSTVGLASKAVKIFCVIAISRSIQESSGLKTDWLTLNRQFRSKKS